MLHAQPLLVEIAMLSAKRCKGTQKARGKYGNDASRQTETEANET